MSDLGPLKRDFIDLREFSAAEIDAMLEEAIAFKAGRRTSRCLADKTIGLIFNAASTRTRVSFQVAAQRLGGQAEYLRAEDLQLVHRESVEDTAVVLSSYLAALVVRLYDMTAYGRGRATLRTLAAHAHIPVINALDDQGHPCQVMADLMTLKARFGDAYRRKTVAIGWVFSERQKSPGVAHSMVCASAILGMDVRLAHPKDFDLDPEYMTFARDALAASGGRLTVCESLEEMVEDADVVYVKDWKALRLSDEEDRRRRQEFRDRWRVTAKHMERAGRETCFMNCMPIIRGEQADADVVNGPRSLIYEQAANRLYVQQAILARCVEDERDGTSRPAAR
jgi:ornithine carbamoyltransferase